MGATVGRTGAERVREPPPRVSSTERGDTRTLWAQAGHQGGALGGSREGLFSGRRQKVLWGEQVSLELGQASTTPASLQNHPDLRAGGGPVRPWGWWQRSPGLLDELLQVTLAQLPVQLLQLLGLGLGHTGSLKGMAVESHSPVRSLLWSWDQHPNPAKTGETGRAAGSCGLTFRACSAASRALPTRERLPCTSTLCRSWAARSWHRRSVAEAVGEVGPGASVASCISASRARAWASKACSRAACSAVAALSACRRACPSRSRACSRRSSCSQKASWPSSAAFLRTLRSQPCRSVQQPGIGATEATGSSGTGLGAGPGHPRLKVRALRGSRSNAGRGFGGRLARMGQRSGGGQLSEEGLPARLGPVRLRTN